MGWCYKRNWIIDVWSRLIGTCEQQETLLLTMQVPFTGDVLLSTRDFVAGDNYTILVEFR